MKTAIRKSPAGVWGWVVALGALGVGAHAAWGLEQELRLSGAGALDVGGTVEASTRSAWLGGELRYALRLAGPLWVHAGLGLASAEGRSNASSSRLELQRLSVLAGAGVLGSLGRRLELGLEAGLSTDRLWEDLYPAGGSGRIRTRVSGSGFAVALRAAWIWHRRWSVPVEVRLQRSVLGGPVEDITQTQLGVTAGLALRLGRRP